MFAMPPRPVILEMLIVAMLMLESGRNAHASPVKTAP
jgi:hypothetical protein